MFNIQNKKLEDGLITMIADPTLDFWGEFAQYIVFKRDDRLPTAGVTFQGHNMLFFYNEEFINKLTEKEVTFLILHELFHLVRSHCQRAKTLEKHRVANIAMDMLINSDIVEVYSKEASMIEGGCVLPVEYEGIKMFEPLYDWLNEKKEERDQWLKENGKADKPPQINIPNPEGQGTGEKPEDQEGDQDGGGQPQDGEGEGQGGNQITMTRELNPEGPPGNSPELNKTLDGMADYEFDVHFEGDVPDEVKDAIVGDILDGIKRKRGTVSSNIEQLLEKMRKHKKNYLRTIQRACNFVKGGKKKSTIKRLSRRNIAGLKGKQRVGSVINVLLDVSGSMMSEFEYTLGILLRDGFRLNMVQCDTEVKSVTVIDDKKGIKNLKICGLGGTTLQPGLDYIAEKFPKYNTCIITDGYTDTLDCSRLNKTIVVTSDAEPPVIGNVKIVQIEK